MSAIGLDWSRSPTETSIRDSVKVGNTVGREQEFRAALHGYITNYEKHLAAPIHMPGSSVRDSRLALLRLLDWISARRDEKRAALLVSASSGNVCKNIAATQSGIPDEEDFGADGRADPLVYTADHWLEYVDWGCHPRQPRGAGPLSGDRSRQDTCRRSVRSDYRQCAEKELCAPTRKTSEIGNLFGD